MRSPARLQPLEEPKLDDDEMAGFEGHSHYSEEVVPLLATGGKNGLVS
jgi:hypothetical protein